MSRVASKGEAEEDVEKPLGGSGSTCAESSEAKPPKQKTRWTIFDPFGRFIVPPPPKSMDEATEIPLATASFISKLTFWWVQPLLVLGFKRENGLEAEDLWKMDASRQAAHLATVFETHFARRRKQVEDWNRSLDDGSWKPGKARRTWWWVWNATTGFGRKDGRRTVGIAMALSDTFAWQFWSAGIFKVVGDLAQTCSPLVTRQIIYFVTDTGYAYRGVPGYTTPHIGKGVGLAIGLFFMQCLYSICTAQTFSRSGQTGILARAALIAAVYRRAMVLSGKSRVTITNSKLVNHISTDISRIDFASSFFHFSWTCIFQLIEVIIILLVNIGVSALAGIALVAVAMPFQIMALHKLFQLRRTSMVFTDHRIKLISELLLGIRVIKLFAWGKPYLDKVHEYRKRELVGIRKLLIIRAGTQALALSIPLLASILVFTTYSLTGHAQNPATIWTSLSLLNLLRMPLMLLPNSLSTITDAHNAMTRLITVFTAETLEETFLIDAAEKDAITVSHASFVWESSTPPSADPKKKKTKKVDNEKDGMVEEETMPPPSKLRDITLKVPRGELWVLCGRVGSGKSSLLQGLIGEMRKTEGTVTFGGSLSYIAQTPWQQNDTVRANILFGREWNEERYWDCVKASCLMPDLDMLPNGDLTQIGEKGVALSGGQRQRVSICRALYVDADIVLADDPLSALDAHVGRSIMDNVILGSLAKKTRILATHAVHFMASADRIICLEEGRIAEEGTFEELMAADGAFARLAKEHGGTRDEAAVEALELAKSTEKHGGGAEKDSGSAKQVGTMQKEERATGGVSGKVYRDYVHAAKGYINVPLLIGCLVIAQSALVLSQFNLTWWQRNLWHRDDAFYMGLYTALGLTSAMFIFISGVVMVNLGVVASRSLHRRAIDSVLAAPISLFDTTPIGRILNRFTKDVDSIDNRLNDSSRMASITIAQIIGSFILVSIINQYFIIAVVVVLFVYFQISKFYRTSAREIKRLDNVLRSGLYAHFSESLAGLSTIRAFGETERFVRDNEELLDLENRAYFLTMVNQRWLAIRLDFLGAILTFVVAIIAVASRHSLNPSQIGIILASILAIQQSLSIVVRQSAEVENNLSSVERLHHYASQLEQEAPFDIAETRPPGDWPRLGSIQFQNVVMSYRPELPPVLHSLSVDIRPGEKVGIVGRTGAGKSTILQCLFRIVELTSGSIVVDGLDISKLGLEVLRKRLAIIPQEATLFNGTLRSNLDPFSDYDDAVLWSALKRASLVERLDDAGDVMKGGRFTLDTVIEDEGSNMSVGERSLVSLARALVKDSQIVVLDEATSSVDFDTDAKIQRTIATEFRDKTLLCIAHRLNSIIGYDRVLVMDKGRAAAFDTPEALFAQEGIFHSLCVQSGITVQDIRKSRQALRSSAASSGASTPTQTD